VTPDPPFDPLDADVGTGVTLVEASAGTGKTFALVGLAVRLVLDGTVRDLSRLLVVTFTRAATDELRGRLRGALAETLAAVDGRATVPSALAAPFAARASADPATARRRLLRALRTVDAAAVSTIHGFCRRELEREAFASGAPLHLTVADEDEAARLHARAARDVWHALATEHAWMPALLAAERWDRRDPTARLLTLYQRLAARPDALLRPETEPLADALDALDAAARDAAAHADGLADALDGAPWKLDAPLRGVAPEAVARAVSTLAVRPTPTALKAALDVGGAGDAMRRQSRADRDARDAVLAHPAVGASAGVADALARVRRALDGAVVDRLRERVGALKAARGLVTNDDLLTRLAAALDDPGRGEALAAAVASRYDAALVDEFQDTDPVQAAIFARAFAGRRPLVYVGDPKQSIYGFRGADLDAYLRARVAADRRHALSTNWRSHSGLVRAVDAVFSAPARPFVLDGVGHPRLAAAGEADARALAGCPLPPLVWWTFEADAAKGPPKPVGKTAIRPRIREAVVHEIRRLLGAGVTVGDRPLRPSGLAVLVAKNAEAAEMQAALRLAGVPSTVARGGDVTTSEEMADLATLLRAAARPADGAALRAALATRLAGWSAAALADLDRRPAEADRLAAATARLARTWRRHGVLRMIEEAARMWDVEARLLAHPDGERRLTNLRHAAELLHRAEGGGRRAPDDLVRWVDARAQRRLADREEAELRLETDENAVQITTVHKAKGLEYEVVFVPSLWDRRDLAVQRDRLPPLVPFGDGVVLDLALADDPVRLAEAEARDLAEHVRLAYVALTRARQRTYVVFGPSADADASALAWLLVGHEADEGATPGARVASARAHARAALPTVPQRLAALVARHPDVMAVTTLPAGPAPLSVAPEVPPAPALRARHAPPTNAPDRVDSFSAWTRDAHSPLPERPGLDDAPDPDLAPAAPPAGFDAFAGGVVAGTALHTILEKIPPARFDTPLGAADHRTIRTTLVAHGLAAPDAHRAPIDPAAEVEALVGRLGTATLPGLGIALRDLDATSAEWTFTLPMASTAPARVAAAVRDHGGPAFAPYADRLALLPDAPRAGYFTGTADLLFAHGGRFGVLDWKTTRLGGNAPDEARAAAFDRHYVLQALLYLAGLDAHLRTRVPDYDYDRHVAGAWIVFLRGVAGDGEAGLVHVAPPAALVRAVAAPFLPPGEVSPAQPVTEGVPHPTATLAGEVSRNAGDGGGPRPQHHA